MTGPSGPLLTPGLGPTTADLSPGLGALSPASASRQLSGDHLVHNGLVRLDAEGRGLQLNLSRLGACTVPQGDVHHHEPPLTALRIRTVAPRGPGTEPLTSRISRSASASTTRRLSVVVRWLPMRPGIRSGRYGTGWRTGQRHPACGGPCGHRGRPADQRNHGASSPLQNPYPC